MRIHGIRAASAILLSAIAIVASDCNGYEPTARIDAFGNQPNDAPGPQFFDTEEGSGHWQHHD